MKEQGARVVSVDGEPAEVVPEGEPGTGDKHSYV